MILREVVLSLVDKANSYLEQNRLQEAEAAYLAARDILPTNAVIHNNLGSIILDKGQLASAKLYFQQALKLDCNAN